MKSSVVREWMSELSLKQQTVVLAALRGCDGVSKEDPSKKISRILRGCVLKNAATPNTKFLTRNLDTTVIDRFREDIDRYPIHYVLHLVHAAEILGYFHPDEAIRTYWNSFYHQMVNTFHFNPETRSENIYRLKDGVDSD